MVIPYDDFIDWMASNNASIHFNKIRAGQELYYRLEYNTEINNNEKADEVIIGSFRISQLKKSGYRLIIDKLNEEIQRRKDEKELLK